ncbi:hypothetical protein PMAYCL1PPCAC_01386 [Pristionchus mayeri]|uniref:G protein-coupled receptor n=1 Tax=Pristionchus mayeri TaxID=1317129 RepID=A0AAN5C7C8_9BILA|nr:hypothetical protein PMAYCL1PPCAC_01386 [Pristionchus mayeri]
MSYTFAVIANANYGLGIILNCILILLLKSDISTRLGSYRYLQMTFAVFNISWTTFCWFCRAKIFTTRTKFCLFLQYNWFESLHFLCVYNAFFSLFIVIITLHFLHRFWILYSPSNIKIFSKSRFLLTLGSFAAPEFVIWHAASYFLFSASTEQRSEIAISIAEEFGIDAHSKPMIIGEYYRDGHFNLRSLAGLGIFVGVVSLGCSFMFFFAVRIHSYLSKANSFSASAKQIHRTILLTLIVQTVIPLIFIHLNIGAFLIAPLFQVELSVPRDFTILVAHFFVPLDAIAVLFFMPQYRNAIAELIWKRKSSYVPEKLKQLKPLIY